MSETTETRSYIDIQADIAANKSNRADLEKQVKEGVEDLRRAHKAQVAELKEGYAGRFEAISEELAELLGELTETPEYKAMEEARAVMAAEAAEAARNVTVETVHEWLLSQDSGVANSAVAKHFGVSDATARNRLKQLAKMGAVVSKKEGRTAYFSGVEGEFDFDSE